MSLMGVDIGTTGIKAVVFDDSGKQLALAYEEYRLQFPFPGAAELNTKEVLQAAKRVIAKAAGEVRPKDPVKAIGLASQGEAFSPFTSDGEVIGNAMVSSDTRAESYVSGWKKLSAERLYQIAGHTPYAMYSLYKLLWLKENQPDVWRRTWKFLFFGDIIAWMLTGETKTDYSLAARSMLFDVKSLTWSDEVLSALELDPAKLPTPAQSGTAAGVVLGDVAEELGLEPGVIVALGGHDQPVGALGCGGAVAGKAAYSIGTVECICPSVDHLILTSALMKANLAMYPHVLPETYTTVAFNLTGGGALKWLRDNIALTEATEAKARGEDPYDRITAAASKEPADVILVPHFGPTGTPHFDAFGAGTLFGIKFSTTRAEIIRAFLEGITYEMKWNLSILEDAGFRLEELRVVGGGGKSAVWMQIKSDVLGIPLTTMQVTEGTCMGAAILAGAAAGALDPAVASSEWAKPIRTFTPRSEYAPVYEERFTIYKEIYNSLSAARRMLHLETRKGE